MATAEMPAEMKFTCLLANMDGNHKLTPMKHKGNELQEIRFSLIEPFADQDVLLLHALSEPQLDIMQGKLGSTHQFYGSVRDTGIFLKNNKFDLVKSYNCDDKDINFQGNERICIVKATLKDANIPLLFISYSCPSQPRDDFYPKRCKKILSACWNIQAEVGARHVIVGGGWNFAQHKFQENVISHGYSGFKIHYADGAKHPSTEDYFVADIGVHAEVEEKTLKADKYYLNHMPLVAEFSKKSEQGSTYLEQPEGSASVKLTKKKVQPTLDKWLKKETCIKSENPC